MGQDPDQVGTPVESEDRSPEQIQREIEDAREDLGDTAAALAAKTDVKARAKEKVEGVKRTLAKKKEALASQPGGDKATGDPTAHARSVAMQMKAKAEANPIPAAAIGAFVGGFLLGRITSR